jgi:hypothetical protein
LGSSANPALSGQTLTLNATVAPVAPGSGTPTGNVSFYDGATLLGTAPVQGDMASFNPAQLSPGTHSITATYGGDADFTGSTSPAFSEVVNAFPVYETDLAVTAGQSFSGTVATF